jgi:hypothetical protein
MMSGFEEAFAYFMRSAKVLWRVVAAAGLGGEGGCYWAMG